MAVLFDSPVCLAVLNPKGRDSHIDYRDGPDSYERGIHAPINFHAYAAATYGAFFDSTEEVIQQQERFDAVLVLIRRRTWITLEAVEKLKQAGLKVLVTWKECSHNQVSRQLRNRKTIAAYGRILQLADGIISPTLAWPPRCGSITQNEYWQKLKFIPTPYPLEFPAWDFSAPIDSRVGIMIGTREFKTESRNHVQAIASAACLAHEFAVPRVTVINSEKRRGLAILRELENSFPRGCLQIIEQPLAYPDYMALLSSHRLVYQMDRSTVPGQVAGDCLLARSICAGGSSTIEKLAFSKFSDDGTIRMKKMFEQIVHLLQDDDALEAAITESQKEAAKLLCFQAATKLFADWKLLKDC